MTSEVAKSTRKRFEWVRISKLFQTTRRWGSKTGSGTFANSKHARGRKLGEDGQQMFRLLQDKKKFPGYCCGLLRTSVLCTLAQRCIHCCTHLRCRWTWQFRMWVEKVKRRVFVEYRFYRYMFGFSARLAVDPAEHDLYTVVASAAKSLYRAVERSEIDVGGIAEMIGGQNHQCHSGRKRWRFVWSSSMLISTVLQCSRFSTIKC